MSILRKFIRLILSTIVVLTFLLVVALLVIRFSPQTALNLANRFSPYDIHAEQVSLRLMPLVIKFANFRLVDDREQQIADLKTVDLEADWIGAIKGRYNFWNVKLSDGEVDLRDFTVAGDDTKTQNASTVTQVRLDIHRLISALSTQINNIKLIVDEHSYVDLQEVSTGLNNDQLFDSRSTKQTIQMSFVYALDESPLVVNAIMESEFKQGFTDIELHIKDLNLTAFAPAEEQATAQQAASDASAREEAVMDWSWLDTIEPIRFKLIVDQLHYPDVIVKNLQANITLEQRIEVSLSAVAQLKISDDLSFDDRFEIASIMTPLGKETKQADLAGELSIKTAKLKATTKGNFNVNGQAGNNLSLDLAASAYPLISRLDPDEQEAIHGFFPAKAVGKFANEQQKISLTELDIVLGQSDFKGGLQVLFLRNGQQRIEGNFTSDKLVLGNSGEDESTAETEPDTPNQEVELFGDEVIDWAWLDSLEADINWSAKLLQLGKFQFSDLTMPIKLQQGRLAIDPLQTGFANGSWTSTIALSKQQNDVQLELASNLQNGLLEAMNLIPKDQISAGKTSLATKLKTQGNSFQQLASSLNGDFLLDIEEGVIGNDYFELIGSDVITGLLSKLNPFVKSDPSTELKCLIANLKIEDGKVLIDKSVALETSKLVLVVDGEIDLQDEKLKLKIVPKSDSGVGVGAGTLVKSITVGGTLAKPSPQVSAGDLLKSGLALGAALSTGGVSLLADGVVTRVVSEGSCKRAKRAKFNGSSYAPNEETNSLNNEAKINDNGVGLNSDESP